jgi:hypothetical protein
MTLALLLNLSDNHPKTISNQCRSSLVVKHGPGGRFEPTTLAQYSKVAFIFKTCPLIVGEDIVNFISRNNI